MSSPTKPGMKPTIEQTEAIAAGHTNLVVTASAGAGKTYVLVQRYLKHILEDGLSPDQILTITFTRKAAAQMKSKIVEMLREKGLSEQAQIAETGPIQTIHGFCERLLRENALEAGLDPEFEVMTEAHCSRLRVDCIRRALTSSQVDDSDEVQKFIGRLSGRQGMRRQTSPYALLESSVEAVLSELRGGGISLEAFEETHGSVDAVLRTWRSFLVQTLPEHARLAFEEQPASQPFSVRLRNALKQARMSGKWIGRDEDEDYEKSTAEDAVGIAVLATKAWRLLEQEMDRVQKLDFSALEARAVHLLNNSEVTQDRVREAYKVVMVDEAQDVNPMQYRLLDALKLEKEMRVGDAQQSIYGFRQADVELFKQRAITETCMRLSKNHRSDAGILRFVDHLFGKLWGEDYVPMGKQEELDLDVIELPTMAGVEIWKDKSSRGNEFRAAKQIQRLIEGGTRAGDIAVLVRMSYYGLRLQAALRELDIPCRISGGTEKFYVRLEIRDIANALKAVADPYDDFALLATLRSPFVGLSLDSIAVIAQETPVFNQLEDFIPPLASDEERLDEFRKWFIPLSKYADRLPAWEVLSEMFAVSPYWNNLAKRPDGQQLLANVRKLLTLATEEPELGPAEFAEQIREIQELSHKEGDAPAEDEDGNYVTIMTIHKSKGLEFPTVVVPDTLRDIGSRSRSVEVDPRLGLAIPKFGPRPNLYHSWLFERRKERERQEELRITYVALTRAERRLCVTAHPQCKPSFLANLIAKQIGLDKAHLPGVEVYELEEENETGG